MNYAQIMSMIRLLLAAGGASALTSFGFDGSALSSVVNGATTPGGLVLGVLPIVASGVWSLYSHTIGATVDRAAGLTGGTASPIAPVAAAAKLQGQTGLKGRIVGG